MMDGWECCQVVAAVIQGRVNGGNLDSGRGSGGEVDQVKRHLGQRNISSGSRSECGGEGMGSSNDNSWFLD